MEQTIDIATPAPKVYPDKASWVATFLGGPLAAGGDLLRGVGGSDGRDVLGHGDSPEDGVGT